MKKGKLRSTEPSSINHLQWLVTDGHITLATKMWVVLDGVRYPIHEVWSREAGDKCKCCGNVKNVRTDLTFHVTREKPRFTHAGYTFERVDRHSLVFQVGKRLRVQPGGLSKRELLERMRRSTKPGYLTSFFSAIRKAGLVKTSRAGRITIYHGTKKLWKLMDNLSKEN